MGIIDQLIRFTGFGSVMRELGSMATSTADIPAAIQDATKNLDLLESTMSTYSLITRLSKDRMRRYNDYEAMDDYGDISVALDIYAEEASQTDLVKSKAVWIEGPDEQVNQELNQLLLRLRIEDGIYGWARTLAKYGDMFVYPRYNVNGIDDLLFLPPKYVARKGKGVDKIIQFRVSERLRSISPRRDGIFYPWELVHFRILMAGESHFYGRSILEPARKRWLHLKLLEDCIAIYRLNRAVERLVFYIDVGSLAPAEAFRVIQRYRQEFSNKRKYLDPSKGSFELQYDPTNMMENYFIPVIGGNPKFRVDRITPMNDQGRLQDLEHFNQKLYVALGIPKDYLTGDISGTWNSREALSLQDVRFSRKIHRIQRALKEGIDTLARLHLVIRFGDADKAKQVPFRVAMADVSKVARSQYDSIVMNRVNLVMQLNALATQLQLNREAWLRYILPTFMPDIPEEYWNVFIIPDSVLAKIQQNNGPQQEDISEERRLEIQEIVNRLREKMAEAMKNTETHNILEELDYAPSFQEEWGHDLLKEIGAKKQV